MSSFKLKPTLVGLFTAATAAVAAAAYWYYHVGRKYQVYIVSLTGVDYKPKFEGKVKFDETKMAVHCVDNLDYLKWPLAKANLVIFVINDASNRCFEMYSALLGKERFEHCRMFAVVVLVVVLVVLLVLLFNEGGHVVVMVA